jgi:hypothetical protein
MNQKGGGTSAVNKRHAHHLGCVDAGDVEALLHRHLHAAIVLSECDLKVVSLMSAANDSVARKLST